MKLKLIAIFFAQLVLLNCLTYAQEQQVDLSFYSPPEQKTKLPIFTDQKIKNVIILIGDGMGFAQISAARIRIAGADGLLHLERMPIAGMVKTHSGNALITDSGAAATALATGHKTNNQMISMTPDGIILETILEAAQQKGMATGLVATSQITHATPAAFGSHVIARSNHTSIASQFLEHKIKVLLGGGKSYFLPKTIPGGKRNDGKNLFDEARSIGYTVVENRTDLLNSNSAYLLGLFADEGLTTKSPEPSLLEMTQKALFILKKDKNGFFLMVEGSQIDWESHGNNQGETIRQMLLFDEAVKEVLDFAEKDRQTLVVLTADHETGGMTINGGKLDGTKLNLEWTTKGHTGVVVPLFAFGPNAQHFTGLLDNTDIPKLISKLAGLNIFSN
jgi:alkaline phosphatase